MIRTSNQPLCIIDKKRKELAKELQNFRALPLENRKFALLPYIPRGRSQTLNTQGINKSNRDRIILVKCFHDFSTEVE